MADTTRLPLKDYTDGDTFFDVLRKQLAIIAAVVRGDVGFLIRGTVTATPGINTSTTAATLDGFAKTVASTSTPEALVGVSTLVDSVAISPLRTNTGAVYVGFSSTDGTQTLVPPFALTAPSGKKIDLSLIYVDVLVNGEGVRVNTVN